SAVVWVWVWDRETQRWKKPPRQARRPDWPASTTDPRTWGTFDQALATFQAGKAAGVGIVLTDGLVGLDLDRCLDLTTGAFCLDAGWKALGVTADELRELIAGLDTYFEKSPRGTGLRGLAWGRLPDWGWKQGPFENYDDDDARYITVTGQHLA